MRISLSAANPFPISRYAFLWEVLRRLEPGRHLDYGCYDGQIVATLASSGVIHAGVGVDGNRQVIEASSNSLPEDGRLQCIEPGQPLPFAAHSFALVRDL